MGTAAHVEQLTRKHRQLDKMIEKEAVQPGASDMTIKELKRQKLRLKEEIDRASAG